MNDKHNCPTSGAAVRVVGDDTKHYEPVEDIDIKSLRRKVANQAQSIEAFQEGEDIAVERIADA